VILGFFRLIFYLIVAYVIYLFLRLLLAPRRPPGRHTNRPQSSGIMVKDETCNTYLPREEAILEKVDGKEYYFCSQECRKKFLGLKKTGT
jgi:YHS domain-containing protein